ncbi:MAG: C40 family peptidase [Flavobacteriaceae bacterium]|nr:C40 family peptidase [Flavobacteriaceae bacterium]
MKNRIVLVVFLVVLNSCKSKLNTVNTTKTEFKKAPNNLNTRVKKYKPLKKEYQKKVASANSVKLNKISSANITLNKVVANALSFQGTKYKYGGTTRKGMDCSGLMHTSFNLAGISLPRTSFEQSKKGIQIALSKVKIGDLLFFKTSKKNRISHVGLVVNVHSKNIEFVHSSNSKGVTISSLNEKYWSKAFTIAKRFF